MAFTFRNGEHHRNPSGCHNKVNWILSQCKWNKETVTDFVNDFIANELLNRDFPNPNHKGQRNQKWFDGWMDALNIAMYAVNAEGVVLPPYISEKYHWFQEICRMNRSHAYMERQRILRGGRGSGRFIRFLVEAYENKIAVLEEQINKMKNFENCDYQLHAQDCPIFISGESISCKKCPYWKLQEPNSIYQRIDRRTSK